MRERHPVQERPDLPIAERVQRLEVLLARLWDQVWWLQLPAVEREGYVAQGFRAPIGSFYDPA